MDFARYIGALLLVLGLIGGAALAARKFGLGSFVKPLDTRRLQIVETLGLQKDPETLAGLVRALRYCGLLEESVAAHEQAVSLDPAIRTSVAHTHFMRGEFARVFETYGGALYYLDAAAWAALGAGERAALLLRERLARPSAGRTLMMLMRSLLAVLEGRTDRASEMMTEFEGGDDPEPLFYMARHYAMFDDADGVTAMVRRARLAGFWSSIALLKDPVFLKLQGEPDFKREIEEAVRLESGARELLHRSLSPVSTRMFR